MRLFFKTERRRLALLVGILLAAYGVIMVGAWVYLRVNYPEGVIPQYLVMRGAGHEYVRRVADQTYRQWLAEWAWNLAQIEAFILLVGFARIYGAYRERKTLTTAVN